MRPIRLIAPLAALVAALAVPTAAGATYQDVIRDCADDGQFSRQYKHDELKAADMNLPDDIREYTDCKSLIEAALARGNGGTLPGGGPGGVPGGGSPTGGTGGPGGGGAVVTPAGAAGKPAAVASLRSATASARHSKPSITSAGETITPTASGLDHVPGAANKLPSSLAAAIVAVIALCTLSGIAATWRRWPGLVRAPLRVFRR